jgi:hypothetical protein
MRDDFLFICCLILLLSWEATMMKFLADAAVLRKLHE